MTKKDRRLDAHMARAVELARMAVGSVSPNPPVGAVIVKDGRVVGEGFTQPPGGAHAEIMALRVAGERTAASDLYVTLEPCAHHGRTHPCVDALIAAGVSRVHVGAVDPNPINNGHGIAALEQGGIEVLQEGSAVTSELVEAFAKHVITGIPFVIAKFAMSLDGKIATHTGSSRWISSVGARRYAHALRASVDAVMIGAGTALADDPQLTVRDSPLLGRQPTRVVIDSTGRLPEDAAMLSADGTTIVAVADVPEDRRIALKQAHAEVLDAPGHEGQVDVAAVLSQLGARGIVSVLVEGGSALLGALFDGGLVDKIVAVVAPVVIGGSEAPGPVGGHGALTMADALRLSRVRYDEVDGDMVIVGYAASNHFTS